MKRFWTSAFILLFSATNLFAEFKLEAPKESEQYKLIKCVVKEDGKALSADTQVVWEISGVDKAGKEVQFDSIQVGYDLVFTGQPATYTVECLCVNFTTKKLQKIKQKVVVKGQVDPGPGPGPDPGPDPDEKPPIPVDGNRVLIVWETKTAMTLPVEQRAVIFSQRVRDYMDKKCVKGADGKDPEWWILDKDEDVSALETHWQNAMKRKRDSLPWIIISTGKKGYEGPLPKNPDEALKLMKKYFGE